MDYKDILSANINKIRSTDLGIRRIQKNLKLEGGDVIEYCKRKICDGDCVVDKRGKNYYCEIDGIVITVNSYSYTIITAHIKT